MSAIGGSILIFLVPFLSICAVAVSIDASSVTVPPSDKVVSVGDNAQFNCRINGDPKVEAVAWKREVLLRNGTVQTEKIFSTWGWPPDKEFDKAKYTFTPSDNNPLETGIMVKNVDYDDAGRYGCGPTSHADGARYGRLVVVGPPKMSLPSSLKEGEMVEMTCEVKYVGPPGIKQAGLEPSMVLKLKGQVVQDTKDIIPSMKSSQSYRLRAVYKKRLTSSLHQQKFSCEVTVHSPVFRFETSTSRTLMITFPVRNVKLVPDRKMYSPEEPVNCTAEGYPEPTIKWEMVHVEGDSENNAVLTNTHKWMCTAYNVVDGVRRFANSTIITYTTGSSSNKDNHPYSTAIAGVVATPTPSPSNTEYDNNDRPYGDNPAGGYIGAIVALSLIIIAIVIVKVYKVFRNFKQPYEPVSTGTGVLDTGTTTTSPCSTEHDVQARQHSEKSVQTSEGDESPNRSREPLCAPSSSLVVDENTTKAQQKECQPIMTATDILHEQTSIVEGTSNAVQVMELSDAWPESRSVQGIVSESDAMDMSQILHEQEGIVEGTSSAVQGMEMSDAWPESGSVQEIISQSDEDISTTAL